LFVSGMESVRLLGGSLSLSAFALWRARADTVLVWVSVLLLIGLLFYPLVRSRRGRHTQQHH
jgi:hypothetical protein